MGLKLPLDYPSAECDTEKHTHFLRYRIRAGGGICAQDRATWWCMGCTSPARDELLLSQRGIRVQVQLGSAFLEFHVSDWPLLVPGVWVLLPLKILSTQNIVWSLYMVERSRKYLLTLLLIVARNLGVSCDLLIHFGIFIRHLWHSEVLSHSVL